MSWVCCKQLIFLQHFPLHLKNNTNNQHLKCLFVNTVWGILSLYIEQVARTEMTDHKRYKVMSNEFNPKLDPSQPMVYQIRIKGHLGHQWTDWFEGLTITLEEDGDTLLTGPVIDQAALHGLLKKVRDLGMPLVSVSPLEHGHTGRRRISQTSNSKWI